MQHRKPLSTNCIKSFNSINKDTTSNRSLPSKLTGILIGVTLSGFVLLVSGMNSMLTSSLSCIKSTLSMPSIGLGTYLISREVIPKAISSALQLGYRRIDCAPVYFSEDIIGDTLATAFSKGDIKRQDIYLVSKLAGPFHRKNHVEYALKKTLLDLRVDYLDLYLIHWPIAFKYVEIDPSKRGFENENIDDSNGGKNIDHLVSVKETWAAMEHLVHKGLVREIGVSNFPLSLLQELLSEATILPIVNQVELHPYLQQRKLLKYCQARGVNVQAYSPLGTPGYKQAGEPNILVDPVLQRIASSHNWTVPQLCLKWALDRGTTVVAKSSNAIHQRDNLAVLDMSSTLTERENIEIASLDQAYRFYRPEDWWGDAGGVFD